MKKKKLVFSRVISKLIEESILPALLLLASKIISLFLINYLLDFSWEIQLAEGLSFPRLYYYSTQEAIIANSYSNLIMYGVMFCGAFWIIIKSLHFHETHISPKATIKLAQFNLLKLITGSFDLYHQAAVWFIFLWIATGIIFIYSMFEFTFWWIDIVALGLTLIFTYLLIDDVEKEYNAWRFIRENHV